jgi:DNA-directed RNA polymerase beta subunit
MKKKIPVYILLKAFGLPDKKIIHSLEKESIINNLNMNTKVQTSKALKKIYELMFGKEINILRF